MPEFFPFFEDVETIILKERLAQLWEELQSLGNSNGTESLTVVLREMRRPAAAHDPIIILYAITLAELSPIDNRYQNIFKVIFSIWQRENPGLASKICPLLQENFSFILIPSTPRNWTEANTAEVCQALNHYPFSHFFDRCKQGLTSLGNININEQHASESYKAFVREIIREKIEEETVPKKHQRFGEFVWRTLQRDNNLNHLPDATEEEVGLFYECLTYSFLENILSPLDWASIQQNDELSTNLGEAFFFVLQQCDEPFQAYESCQSASEMILAFFEEEPIGINFADYQNISLKGLHATAALLLTLFAYMQEKIVNLGTLQYLQENTPLPMPKVLSFEDPILPPPINWLSP